MKKLVPEGAILIPEDSQRVFGGKIFDVYQWPQTMFDGSSATFEMLRRPDTMQIIAIKDGNLVLVNDEQPNRAARLSFPGGRADHENEPWLAAAQRELLEETGMTFRNWKMIEVYQPLGKVEWFVAWFVATDFVSEGAQELDNGEKISVEVTTFDEVRSLALSTDSSAMGHALPLFSRFLTLQELLDAPAFTGREIDR